MFSSSFASSAASGVERTTTSSQISRVELAGALGAGLGHAADQLRRGPDRVVGAAGVDPLRREGEVELLAGRHPGLLEDRQQPLPGGARVGGRLEHHELARPQDLGERIGGIDQVGEVRFARARQRRRDADDHRVAGLELGVVARRLELAAERSQRLVGDVLDVAAAGGERLDLARVGVEADHLVTHLGESDREGQADVAEADNPDLHGRDTRPRPGRCSAPCTALG